ncbi:MAG: hypothetical protein IPJ19_06650 [Planctomycetes bacterium]|nr:hypothetical protein [Planctomycetota bacterium]
MKDALQTFGAALGALQSELDWELLGRCACEGDGSDFYDTQLRERILDTGLRLAEDIGRALGEAPGRSLYLGAEVAELPLVLAEQIVLGRRVDWLNLECEQTRELARAIRVVGERQSVELPLPRALELSHIEAGSCNHLWMVSVLTDPDHFPALHDELYERRSGPLATGRGSLEEDRERAQALIELLLTRAAPECVLSTSDEERGLIEPLAARSGWTLHFAPGGRISAVVGDRVRIGKLRRAGGRGGSMQRRS